ncbi:quaternary amine ABC transporter ATP-binding protein [Seinonella peptonophila]|uniref:quaternary amine ABC transporter ATP-binding protein n=1 Tax=Seinonella peptonophila TaxID=112248 RepID=UPI000933CD5E|nr:glycine betaine/L-proline ABC transporter ATP-binding protein [Seinonella peptonophila]
MEVISLKKIEVRNVTKIFGRTSKKALKLLINGVDKKQIYKKTGLTVGVNQVSFDVETGEIFVIMGLSGSGKSTLLRMLNRLIEPTVGQIFIDGEDIVQMPITQLRHIRRKKLAMVFQHFALFPHRTVRENVEYGLEIQGVEIEQRKNKALEVLQLVGLDGWGERYPDELSGGMQQRVGLARALANDPDILMMDEAFSALDPLIRKEMQDELLELQRSLQRTIIFITHDLDEALRIGDRIALMRDGSIVQIGTPEEILTNPADEYVKKFVEDVNLTDILTIESIMRKGETVLIGREGCRVALKKMREKGIPTLVAIDRDKKVQGLLTADGARKALETGKSVADVLVHDVVQVSKESSISELLPIMAEQDFTHPAVVVDDNQRLIGIVGRGAIFAALAGTGGEDK